ncbi:DNA polymerase-3 subunit alpha [Lachnospiraceae bacterium XBB1006]|nr:DNA polymerase-3 subunit alpha [Lachnospiraceae bacterium XBB1006]
MKCLICGQESHKYICDSCKDKTDIDELCNEVVAYIPGLLRSSRMKPLWEEIAGNFERKEEFARIAYELADELGTPRKEYQKIHSLAGKKIYVAKKDRELLYKNFSMIDGNKIPDKEMARVEGLMLSALVGDYKYSEAENFVDSILEKDDIPWQAYYAIADFYNKTRRYDTVEKIMETAIEKYSTYDGIIRQYQSILESCKNYKMAKLKGTKEYVPNPKEDKKKVVDSYFDYLESIGVEYCNNKRQKAEPKALPKAGYPEPVIINTPNFDTFVAYDFETTGFSPAHDSIIDFGAVRVVDGEVVESKEFIFSEFAKPYKKLLTEEITMITGITKEDLADARKMWEVAKDFLEFVGDDILVGFNNASFDAKFLARAGRYAGVVVNNPNFDLLQYIRSNKESLGFSGKSMNLESVSKLYGIENPQAHRAWADALTTAKLFMKIKQGL